MPAQNDGDSTDEMADFAALSAGTGQASLPAGTGVKRRRRPRHSSQLVQTHTGMANRCYGWKPASPTTRMPVSSPGRTASRPATRMPTGVSWPSTVTVTMASWP